MGADPRHPEKLTRTSKHHTHRCQVLMADDAWLMMNCFDSPVQRDGLRYLLATALTWRISVTPASTFNTPSCNSVVIPSCCAHAATSVIRARC